MFDSHPLLLPQYKINIDNVEEQKNILVMFLEEMNLYSIDMHPDYFS